MKCGQNALVHSIMTFRKAALQAYSPQTSSQNSQTVATSDLWEIFRALRDAHQYYGLRAGQLQTLQAMLSVLKPGQGNTVFASNTELCRRVGGIDERTLRRHIERFVKLGFVQRHNSPNNKRYRLKSSEGASLSFGLSLTPFFEKAEEIIEIAKQIQRDQRDRLFLRKKILTQLARLDEARGEHEYTIGLRKILRRKLTLAEYHDLWTEIEDTVTQMSTAVDIVETAVLPANDGQNARQLSKSKKESIDKERNAGDKKPSILLMKSVCKEACSFSQQPINTWEDVEAHARTLAPMMGINSESFQNRIEKIGAWKASAAIFILLQMGHRIKNFAAYFSAITSEAKVMNFKPHRLLNKLNQDQLITL